MVLDAALAVKVQARLVMGLDNLAEAALIAAIHTSYALGSFQPSGRLFNRGDIRG